MKSIIITLNNTNGEGILHCQGFRTFKCLGKPRNDYKKTSIVIHPKNKNEKQRHHRSIEYGGYDMEFSLLVDWKRGIYIHAGPNSFISNDGSSAGCIYLSRIDAEKVYNWVNEPTSVIIKQ